MKELIHIHNIQFYHGNIQELIDYSSVNKCALIIDEKNIRELINVGVDKVPDHVNQIIIISETLNLFMPKLVSVNAFIIAADNFQQAVRFCILSEDLNQDVICVVEEDMTESKKMVEMIII